jgi:hypothetical protein
MVINSQLQSKLRQSFGVDLGSENPVATSSPIIHKETTLRPPVKAHTVSKNATFTESHDTAQLTVQIKGLFKKLGISQRSYALNVAGIKPASLYNMLLHPKPWATLTETAQRHYLELLEFFKRQEALQSLAAPSSSSKNTPSLIAAVASISNAPAEDIDRDEDAAGEWLDTKQIAKRVHTKLHERKISQAKFAVDYLNINHAQLSHIMLKPKDWNDCSPYLKGLYKLMDKWLAGLE